MEVTPAIRTASRDFYLAYLNSPAWRTRRNHALRLAEYRCQRCDSKRNLQVHHRSYERLGREWDDDLEVLCETCHRGEHLEHPDQTTLGVYLKLASEAVQQAPFSSIADLSDTIKRRCIALKIPVIPERIHGALSVVCGNRLKTEPAQTREDVLEAIGRPLTEDEVRDIWCRLDLGGLLKVMPSVGMRPAEQRAHEAKIRAQADEFRGQKPREKRRPLLDRLKEIFAGGGW